DAAPAAASTSRTASGGARRTTRRSRRIAACASKRIGRPGFNESWAGTAPPNTATATDMAASSRHPLRRRLHGPCGFEANHFTRISGHGIRRALAPRPTTLHSLSKEKPMRLAERMSVIGTETAFEVSARARALQAEGRDIIHLQIGEPDFDTPANAREAAKRALDDGATHYAPYPGIPALREAIAEDAQARKGFPVTPDRVFVTVGGKGVMLYAILGLVDPGDEVLVPDPGYPIYESLTRFVGGTPVPVPIRMEHDFRIDLDELASLVTPRTRLLVINSPANPTGGVLTRTDLEAIADLAIRHDLVVLADEIYGRILYDGEEHVSIASLPGMAERTIVLDGFSKTFAMTGWRLGYAIVPPSLIQMYGQLVINTISCAPTFAQIGAVEALRGPQGPMD